MLVSLSKRNYVEYNLVGGTRAGRLAIWACVYCVVMVSRLSAERRDHSPTSAPLPKP